MTIPTNDLDALRTALVELTPAQALAVDAIAAGSTHEDAAEAAGVTRETVNRWANHHPGFQSAVDRYRHVLADELAMAACRLRAKAIMVIDHHLEADDLSAALTVLRAVQPPELTILSDADDRLAATTRRLASNVGPPPMRRSAEGRIDRDSESTEAILYNTTAERAERAERMAIEHLADAACVETRSQD